MGWNKERVLDKNKLIEDLVCCICGDLLENPMQTPCQHAFCNDCIKKWFDKGNHTCPVDRETIPRNGLKPARLINQLLNDLVLCCMNYSKGCHLMVKFEHLHQLVNHETNFCTQSSNSLLEENKKLKQTVEENEENMKVLLNDMDDNLKESKKHQKTIKENNRLKKEINKKDKRLKELQMVLEENKKIKKDTKDNDKIGKRLSVAPATGLTKNLKSLEHQKGHAQTLPKDESKNYDNMSLKLVGDNPPKPLKTFENSEFHEILQKNIKAYDFKGPMSFLKYAIPTIKSKRDLIAYGENGNDSTIVFLLAIIQELLEDHSLESSYGQSGVQNPPVIILAPNGLLVVKIRKEAQNLSTGSQIKVCGDVEVTKLRERASFIGCHILIATPRIIEKLIDKGDISLNCLRYLLIDRVDRMIEEGLYNEITCITNNEDISVKKKRQTLMFSESFPKRVQNLANSVLHEYLMFTVGEFGEEVLLKNYKQ